MDRTAWPRKVGILGSFVAFALLTSVAHASAATVMMPDRIALKSTPVVVWGNTHQANGTAFSLDCGDGEALVSGTVGDRSYISRSCTYTVVGTFTATLTVGAETATAKVSAVDPVAMTAFDLRSARINMAIEDGLRFLYFSQINRAANFDSNKTSWRTASNESFTNSFSALATLAIQNHGHSVTADPAKDIFQPVVQRGLNSIFDKLVTRDLTPCDETHGTSHDNPCVGVPAPANIALSNTPDSRDGYATPILAAAVAAATNASPTRTVDAGLGSANAGFVVGRTYSEILQRIVNSVSWGQSDSGLGEGGWYYNLQAGSLSDGSTMGWSMLGLIDSGAAGAIVPAFVKSEFTKVLTHQLLASGSMAYQATGPDQGNVAKAGIGLQGLAFSGATTADPRTMADIAYLTRNWNSTTDSQDFVCSGGSPTNTNKGCGYAMFNIFKGLKLLGVTTLPGIGRPAGPGPIAADDWYADYVDNLLANQHLPSDPTRGEWSTAAPSMGWSCCETDTTGITAMAELILAPVAFVLPDPVLFSTVGLAPATATNPVGTTHTVTATAESSTHAPVVGATVVFKVLTGPNAGQTGSSDTDSNGQATFTYSDTGGAGTDTIQASIGTLTSNIVSKIWAVADCDSPVVTLSAPMYPLDHGLRSVSIAVASPSITAICQDEDPNFENIAAYSIDGGGLGTNTAQVRAERSGTRAVPGNGRVYHIFFSTPSCSGEVNVAVPIVAGGSAVDDGALFNSVTGGACTPPR
jgi:hypothetical protein